MDCSKFWSVDKDVARRKDLSSTAKLVFAVLNDYQRLSNRNGRKHPNPGIRRISDDIGVPKSTVEREIRSLCVVGLIEVISGTGRATNQYRIKSRSVPSGGTQEVRSVPDNGTQTDQVETVVSQISPVVSQMEGRSVPPAGRTNNYNQELITNNILTPSTTECAKSPPDKPPKEKKPRKPDPLWDTLAELFKIEPKTKSECARMGKAVRDLKIHEATADDIRTRFKNYHTNWPGVTCTVEALIKHWQHHVAVQNGKSNPARPRNQTEYADISTRIA